MSDATGGKNRPGAGPINSHDIYMDGVRTGHYSHHNPETGKYEVVRAMPSGIPDAVVREFDSYFELQVWANGKWSRTGRISSNRTHRKRV